MTDDSAQRVSKGEPLWTLRDVSVRGRSTPRLDGVSLTLPAGRVALAGVSGAGKSSLLGLLAGFERSDTGTVTRHEEGDSSLPVFWSPQNYGLWSHLSVREHLEHVCPESSRTGVSVDKWLERFRLTPLADARPAELSEGEQSRLSVARALASEAEVLLFDEPLAHVDAAHRESDWRAVMDFASEFCRGIIFATHEPPIIRAFADHVVSLDRGRIQFAGSVEQLLHSPPDHTAAWILGPCNWLDQKTREFFPEADSGRTCIRPEETRVNADSAGRFAVTRIDRTGTQSRFELSEGESAGTLEVYAMHNPQVEIGTRVQIELALPRRRSSGAERV